MLKTCTSAVAVGKHVRVRVVSRSSSWQAADQHGGVLLARVPARRLAETQNAL